MSNEFTQELTLPSLGLLNPEIPEGKLVQRCMMVADQKFLSGSNLSPGVALQQLIQRTITSPETFDVSKLTLPDTMYLLFKLRVLSYGETYKFRTKCPECGKKIDVSINLADLPVEKLDISYTDNLVVDLPHRKDTVFTRILTNGELEDIESEIARRNRRNPDAEDPGYVLRIVKSIDKIVLRSPNKDGKKELTHPLDIERYIESLTDLDAATIIAARNSIRYGLLPTVEHVCPNCRNYIDVSLQFSGAFFRPTIS